MIRPVGWRCQDVSFMNYSSCMIEENHLKQDKSPLRLLREQAGLTRPQVKQLIGVSERRQADWESGKAMPSVENVVALCRLYKVSMKTMCKSLGVDVTGVPNDEWWLTSKSKSHPDVSIAGWLIDYASRRIMPGMAIAPWRSKQFTLQLH